MSLLRSFVRFCSMGGVMNRFAIAVTAILGITTVVFAQSGDPIAQRRALMKSNAAAAGNAGKMLKGETPYDKSAAEAALKQLSESAAKGPSLFPAGSDKGDTRALPKIWENKADFDARFAKLGQDAAAAQSKTGSLDEFRAAFGPIGQNCAGCHQEYRRPQ
jgi:cytochrome c556